MLRSLAVEEDNIRCRLTDITKECFSRILKKLQGLELLNVGGINTGVPYLGMHVKYTVAVPEKYIVSIDVCHCQNKTSLCNVMGLLKQGVQNLEKKKKEVR